MAPKGEKSFATTQYATSRRALNGASGGSDFYVPFWSDAKNHTAGVSDLRVETDNRIEANHSRRRLYPELRDGFLDWWENRRRWTNQEIGHIPVHVKGRINFEELDATVKVENLLGLQIGPDEERLIYPYFFESPVINGHGARLSLWALSEAIPDHDPDYFRVLDISRGQSVGLGDYPLRGDEREEFELLYARVLREWQALFDDYMTR